MAMVKLLLQKGADIEQNTCGYAKFHSDKFGKPIHCAIETEDVEMVKLLITAGADVNAYSERNRTRTTPLSRAVHSNNKEIVLLLLQSGADTTAVGHFIGHINLYGGERWHQRPSDGETALELACSSGYLDIVKILVEYGANVDQQGACGWTALHCAAYQAHDDTLSYLLHDAKASTNLVLSNNCTPFHALMMSMFKRERFYKCADIMLNAGFDINAKSDVGTALHLASYRAEMIVYLLSNGADPSITNNEGQKPLDMMMLKAKGVTFTTYNYEEAIMVLEEVNAKMEDWTLV
jgi:ankyrin repeat protein